MAKRLIVAAAPSSTGALIAGPSRRKAPSGVRLHSGTLKLKRAIRRQLQRWRPNVNDAPYWDRVYQQEWEGGEVTGDAYLRDYGPIHDAIVELIPDGARVIDIGCGTGVLCRKIKLRRPTAKVLGVDFSPYAIARNRDLDRQLGVDYLCVDVRTDLPTVQGEFDVVTMCEVIEHLEHPESVIADAMSLLRAYGLFILTCPHDSQVPDREHVRDWGHDELFHLLCRYGDTVTFKQPPGLFARWMLAYVAKSPPQAAPASRQPGRAASHGPGPPAGASPER